MAIIIANDGDRVVATIADRNAIARKFDGMQVTVQDAIADVLAGQGEALYQWSASKSKWILIGKENIDNLEFKSESAVLVNGKVTASEFPQSALVWDCYVVGPDNSVVADITAPAVANKQINIGTLAYDGLTIHFSYGYGKIQAAVAAIIDIDDLTSVDSSTPSNMSGFVYGTGSILSAKALTASDVTDFSTEVAALTQAAIDSKAPIANPTFTGTVAGITKAMVGLGNVDNTTDANKPVSTATQSALDTKAALAGSATQDFATNTLTVSGNILPAGANIDIGSATQRFKTIFVDEAKLSTNTLYIGDTAILGTYAQTVNIHADPNQSIDIQTSGTGTTTLESAKGITATTTGMNADVFVQAIGAGSNVRLGATNEVQITANAVTVNAPITGTSQTLTGNLTIGGNLTVNGTQTTINSTTVTTKDNIIVLNNGEAGSGVTLGTAGFRVDRGDLTDYELSFDEADDFFKLGEQGHTEIIATRPWVDGKFSVTTHNHTIDSLSNVSIAGKAANDVFKWNGTAWFNGQISKTEVGLGNVDNTSDSAKPVSSAQAAALSLKADAANPTFTGTVTGVTSTMVGLGAVDNVKQLPYSQSFAITGDVIATSTNLNTGTISTTLASVGTAGSYFKVTTDAKGRVTAGNTALVAADIPDVSWSKITSGKPTNLSGYGITDAQTLNSKLTSISSLSDIATGLVKFVNGVASFDSTVYLTAESVTKTMVGLANVDNTSDADKPVSTAQQTALDLKAPLASPTFTGTVGGITKAMVGLGSVDNTADTAKPVSTAQQAALDLKAPLASPTFTGTVSGITKSMVGLANVNNTTDMGKPVSTAQQAALDLKADASSVYTKTETDTRIQAVIGAAPAALDTLAELAAQITADESGVLTLISDVALKAPIASPTFTGTVGGITKAMVGLNNVDNTTDLNKPVSTATQTALDLKAPIASPTFTGTVGGITKAMVGLNNVDNTTDLNKPVSTATQTALDLKAPLASPTFTGTVTGITKAMVGLANVDNTTDANKPVSTATQSALDLKAPLASPTFTGTVGGITKAMVGLGNVDNTTDLSKPVSTAQQTALDLKAPLASPTFTGTVGGITKAMVGLANVDNTADTAKPVSTAQQTALDLKAPLASPTFTGTVSGITKAMVGLANVDNTADLSKPISTATQTALNTKADQATTYTKTETDSRIQAVVGAAPAALDTLVEIAAQLASDESAASALATTVASKAPLASPTFTGTVSGITKAMVGLGNVDNTSDLNKPVSTAQAAAIAVETTRAEAAEALKADKATTYTKTEVDAAIAAAIAAFAATLYV